MGALVVKKHEKSIDRNITVFTFTSSNSLLAPLNSSNKDHISISSIITNIENYFLNFMFRDQTLDQTQSSDEVHIGPGRTTSKGLPGPQI